jgi:hypothetical protein
MRFATNRFDKRHAEFGRLMTGRHREGVPRRHREGMPRRHREGMPRRHREGKAPPAPYPINKQQIK